MINFFPLDPPMKKIKKSKHVKHVILMNFQNNSLMSPVLLKEYNLVRPNNESSFEQ